jgi:chromosome segregation ATPase
MLEFLGIPITGWISSAGIVTLVGLFFRRDVALRKISSSEAGDLRDHYAEELKALREKLNSQEQHFTSMEKHWREMLEASDHRHEECEKARQAMRRELSDMHDEIAGLKRQISITSANKLIELEGNGAPRPSEVAPHATASAARVKDIAKNGDK